MLTLTLYNSTTVLKPAEYILVPVGQDHHDVERRKEKGEMKEGVVI